MPRYFFSVRSFDGLVPDEDGVELPSEVQAREYAVRIAQMIKENVPDCAGIGYEVVVTADDKAWLFTVPFDSPSIIN